MSYRIVHLIKPNLRVRLRLDQLQIIDKETGEVRSIPLADVAVVIAATHEMSISASALRRMAELNVLLLVCNEHFEPCSLTLPYYRATNTDVLRRQTTCSLEWKENIWRRLVTAKIRNQAAVFHSNPKVHDLLRHIADLCEHPSAKLAGMEKTPLDQVTPTRRAGLHSDTPSACEARAARHYWRHFFHGLSSTEWKREPGSRSGVNGMLDYAYAVLRTAVLRSLAAHGFIAALGLHHADREGSFALADDLMEPLRPWADKILREHLEAGNGEGDMKAWIPAAANLLAREVRIQKSSVRFLHAIDLLVQSFQRAILEQADLPLKIPIIPDDAAAVRLDGRL
ncbi:MAG: CRISPR-associated endonuclease Cas1 [Kiritimatiellae bacterium]|nr:CRISPR-associated endonuclease Cas1 [Kiritimatiellia bacterium]